MTQLPMLEKRVDEAVGLYYEFGHNKLGYTDVHSGGCLHTGDFDVFTELPREVAEKVIAAHDRFREELYQILCDKGGAK